MNRSGEIKEGGPKSLLCAQQADSIQDKFPDERRVAACESKSGSARADLVNFGYIEQNI